MSISYNHQINQSHPFNFIKIKPSGDNPLDLYAIFSRNRYKRDFSNRLKRRDEKIVDMQAKFIYRDIEQAKNRANRDRVVLHVHKNMIRVKVESAIQGLPVGGGKRGNVAGFSDRSRKRMIDLMNCQRHGSPKTFVSLTYADEALWNESGKRISDSDDWKDQLEAIRKRIERKLPDVLALWRIELKTRKSGKYIGKIAPHFHLLVWNVSKDDMVDDETTFDAWLRQAWFEIVASGNDEHLERGTYTSEVKSARNAMFYVSKYVAKVEDDFVDCYEVGRRWGRIGIFDTSVSLEIILSEAEHIQFRRLLRAWLKSKGRDYAKRIAKISIDKGFTVYGIGDGQDIGMSKLDYGLILMLIFHATEVVSISIG